MGGKSLKRPYPETPSGCISSFFHFFDLHPFHFSFQQHHPHNHQPPSSNNADHTIPTSKGTEAPRNSLESVDTTMVVASISRPESLEIPKNKLFIKTSTAGISGSSNNVDYLSPGTKTPTLVARLMGLDLLPESPSSSSSPLSSSTTSSCLSATRHHNHQFRPRRQQQHNSNVVITKARHSMDDRITASRFFPETPPISSARKSDVEHRLSLQINKENNVQDLELPRFSFSKLKFKEQSNSSRSPKAVLSKLEIGEIKCIEPQESRE